MPIGRWFMSVALLASWALLPAASLAGPTIGNAFTVVQEVKGKQDEDIRILVVNDNVFADEEISTGRQSATKMVFKDNTQLSMGQSSRMVLNKVIFDPNPSNSAVALKAAQGVFRMSTGKLPSSAYRIDTPVATIGVRGTVIEYRVKSDGTTTVYVSQGAATLTANIDLPNNRVVIPAGYASTVAIGPDGKPLPPTEPGPPDDDFVDDVRNMTMLIQLAGAPDDSPAAGPTTNTNLGQVFDSVQLGLTGFTGFSGPGNTGFQFNSAGIGIPSSVGLGVVPSVVTPTTVVTATPPAPTPPGGGGGTPPCDPSKQTCTNTTTTPNPPAPPCTPSPNCLVINGPPQVVVTNDVGPQTRIGSSVHVTVSADGAVTGTLGGGQGGLQGSGAVIDINALNSQTVTYRFVSNDHGAQQGGVPISLPTLSTPFDGTLTVNTQAVGPEFGLKINPNTPLPPNSGIDFGKLFLGQSRTINLVIGNTTTDDKNLGSSLVGLTILSIEICDLQALVQNNQVVCGTDPKFSIQITGGNSLLLPGDELDFSLLFTAPDFAGLFNDDYLRIVTDQGTDFGQPGETFGYRLFAEVVPEPAGSALALLLLAAAGLAARRRRS